MNTMSDMLDQNRSLFHNYEMPFENDEHEATWLSWPHHYEYGKEYRNRLDLTWIAITKALYDNNENVNIIVYDLTEKERLMILLDQHHVINHSSNNDKKNDNMISYYLFPTNDVWVRDNGPIFVRNKSSTTVVNNNINYTTTTTTILDWNFNAWGNKKNFTKDNEIPRHISTSLNMPIVDLNNVLTLEGGSFEHDGRGTFLATKSAILNKNRNSNMTQKQVEIILNKYLGVTNFIWLNGKIGGDDLTDCHIDGFARFATNNTIITMNEADLDYYYISKSDIQTLYNAKDIHGVPYHMIHVPLTKHNIITTYGKKLKEKGSYCNFYVANHCVLIPSYNDDNDNIVKAIFEKLFLPLNRKVIQIDCRNLIVNGGMIHCVTQQQPK